MTTGIAASGGPPALASTAAIPIQLVATVRLAEKWNVLSRARASWMINRSSRDAGAPTSSHVDELSGMLALQRSQFWNYLEGYYAGVAYRELEGGRFVGLVFGNSGGEEVTSTQR